MSGDTQARHEARWRAFEEVAVWLEETARATRAFARTCDAGTADEEKARALSRFAENVRIKVSTEQALASRSAGGEHSIPRDKAYPPSAVQCDGCGGHGCAGCGGRGWVGPDDMNVRLCLHTRCKRPIHPARWALYCSNECARMDA